jgi:hypothetical protein
MNYDFDVVAAMSALGGAIAGAIITAFRWGKNDVAITAKIDSSFASVVQGQALITLKINSLSEKVTLVTDELARRITTLEQRYQYDGLYTAPRLARTIEPKPRDD